MRPVLRQLVRVGLRILGREDLAWDAVQEALLSLWMQDPVPPNPRAWLIRAVVHRSLHLARTDRRRRQHEAGASCERREVTVHDDPSRALIAEEETEAVKAALAQLNDRHRAVLTHFLLEEMDYATIARIEGVPIGTVRSRLSRSRQALRDALEEDD
ncbi:MAG: sigma-70 family RNA polymerase sigma factor [Isosphaeraceae bacterium]